MTRVLPAVPVAGLMVVMFGAIPPVRAGEPPSLRVVEVTDSGASLIGEAGSASQGAVSAEQLRNRPMLRPAEALETVPGLIVTQHSGDGKANQYFLRGFNLDHGTDFATFVLGMPVNLPTHAHGQGYSDLNFLIPELVTGIHYRKGSYAAEQGDFSAAGSASFDYRRRVPAPELALTAGERGYRRLLATGSQDLGGGSLLAAFEAMGNGGPWAVPESLTKTNLVLRYSQGTVDNGWAASLLAYDARWNATDQVASRAVNGGLIDRFGSLDATDGGKTRRTALAAEWARTDAAGRTLAHVYAYEYALNLFSNFTYRLDYPATGDQFEQVDRRHAFGGDWRHTFFHGGLGESSDSTLGVQLRDEHIGSVGLYRTRDRQRIDKLLQAYDENGNPTVLTPVPATLREDRVHQTSVSLFLENETQWTGWLRAIVGLRSDHYRLDVGSLVPENAGLVRSHLTSPKLTLVFGPWRGTEFYANYGMGFHSNDARGATATVDPTDRTTPVSRVNPLVRTRGSELGIRSDVTPGLTSTLALWQLSIDSELLFVGDAGVTEASRPSRRSGVEWSNFWQLRPGVIADASLAWSRARFRDGDPAGSYIPDAISRTASLGVAAEQGRWSGGARLRAVGARPLMPDDSVRAPSSTLVNLRAGYRLAARWRMAVDVLNVFDRKVSDIDYYYASRLAGESRAVNDLHTHPAEPRTVRLTLMASF
ncbi:MAG TPA: TonB-dependent receptor [Rhodocyclaceae bacterium]|uniref:TonB-dependent receptor n=1 Tax=Zoogloea sp. TaxID=49181 RepID=UPI002BA2DF52|nr:TonB-dependent receptor [Zoogloea sp.]HMV63503.1 TonB-dependent receptor [Rhodocyclaceae bacterium]HMW52126.1 TonB-dependent receptor [Rhodocyclaceae bacterium]HMY48440.1 TonB-dependent receptor [Rhodocyclaceae bacterium]HMZ75918.1 TonB-dependent receptor [Rhodocyclaceae bacterium]HNA67966.1 TonB-dependent receptor [Rhodocyclaceae bacterium]